MKSKLLINIIFITIFFIAFTNKSYSANVTQKPNIKESTRTAPASNAYIVPQRMIIVSPYASYIYANDLFVNTIKDQSGWGLGLNIRTQIYKDFGYFIDATYTNLEIVKETVPGTTEEKKSDLVAIITGGFYYSFFHHSLTDMRLDISYGAITAGDNVMTIFIPALEVFEKISDRVILFARLSSLITNDWIVNQDYDEHYKSFSLSAGLSFIF
jgi:hypothetical protein